MFTKNEHATTNPCNHQMDDERPKQLSELERDNFFNVFHQFSVVVLTLTICVWAATD